MPILDSFGRPVGTAVLDAPVAPYRQEKQLSSRDAEIIRSITLWEMSRRLSPILICKLCHERTPDWKDRDKTTVDIATNAAGSLLAQCGCSAWVCTSPVALDTSDVPLNPIEIITSPSVLKKQRPIGTKEARLLMAWRQVMLDHHWFELLSCMDCAKHDLTFCKCATIPDKSITVSCDCTDRTWTGVTK